METMAERGGGENGIGRNVGASVPVGEVGRLEQQARSEPRAALARSTSRAYASRWKVAGLCVAAAAVYVATAWPSGDLGRGSVAAAVMLAFGAVVAFVGRSETTMPALCVAAGAAYPAAQSFGGDLGQGLVTGALMLAFGAALAGARPIEATRGPGDARGGERTMNIGLLRATAFAGAAMILTCVVGLLGGFVGGDADGLPYALVMMVGGLVYLVGAIVARPRG